MQYIKTKIHCCRWKQIPTHFYFGIHIYSCDKQTNIHLQHRVNCTFHFDAHKFVCTGDSSAMAIPSLSLWVRTEEIKTYSVQNSNFAATDTRTDSLTLLRCTGRINKNMKNGQAKANRKKTLLCRFLILWLALLANCLAFFPIAWPFNHYCLARLRLARKMLDLFMLG